MDWILRVQPLVLIVFIYATMIYLGLSMTVGDILRQFKRPRPILIALLVNIALSPLLAAVLGRALGLPAAALTTLVLLNLFAGAPAGPKNVDLAGGDRPLSIAIVVTLSLAVLLIVPFSARLFLADIQVDPWQILRSLVVLILIPLGIGLLVRAFIPKIAKGLGKAETLISNLFMVLVLLSYLIPNWRAVLSVGWLVLLVYLLVIALNFGLGYLLTFGPAAQRKTVSLITITKNFGIAMSLAPVAYPGQDLTPYLMCFVVLLLVFSLPLSLLLRRVGGAAHPADPKPTDSKPTV